MEKIKFNITYNKNKTKIKDFRLYFTKNMREYLKIDPFNFIEVGFYIDEIIISKSETNTIEKKSIMHKNIYITILNIQLKNSYLLIPKEIALNRELKHIEYNYILKNGKMIIKI